MFFVQLTVYNYKGGPCYRCLYPVPPPPETVTNCSDGGVLGVGEFCPPPTFFYENNTLFVTFSTLIQVPGIMGCFQALEVLKIASGQGRILYFSVPHSNLLKPPLCHFVSLFWFLLPSHCEISTVKCWNRFYCINVLCMSDKTNRNIAFKEKNAIVFRNGCGFFVLSLIFRLIVENRRSLSWLLHCIIIQMLTSGHDASFREIHCFSLTKLPNVAILTLPVGKNLFRHLFLDCLSQLPAVSTCWCLMLRISDSGPSGSGPNRLAVRCVEKIPAWPG